MQLPLFASIYFNSTSYFVHRRKKDILEAKVETDGDTDCYEFIVGVSGHNDFLDGDKIHEILHDIREAVGDTEAQVQLLPIDEDLVSMDTKDTHSPLHSKDTQSLTATTATPTSCSRSRC